MAINSTSLNLTVNSQPSATELSNSNRNGSPILEKTASPNFDAFLSDEVEIVDIAIQQIVNNIVANPYKINANSLDEYYERLKEKGIGSKPTIIFVSEFIPLKAKETEELKNLNSENINFSQKNIAVTNIVKLIELQNILNKQVNKLGSDYIIKNAVSESVVNVNQEDLNNLKNSLYDLYTLILKRFNLNFKNYIALANKIEIVNEIKNDLINEENVTSDFINKISEDFLYLLCNLAINNIFIRKTTIVIGIISESKILHENALDFLSYTKNSSFSQNEFSNYFENIKSDLDSIAPEKVFLNADFVKLNNVLTPKNNISQYLNLCSKLLSDVSFYDSIKSINSFSKKISYDKITFSSFNDLKFSIDALKSINFPNLIHPVNRHPDNQNVRSIQQSDIRNILESTGESTISGQIAELLSAICFDQVSGANIKASNGTVFHTDNNITVSSIHEYITKYMMGKTLTTTASASGERLIKEYSDSILSNNENNNLLKTFFSKLTKEISGTEVSTIPFENEDAIQTDYYENNITDDSFEYFVLNNLIEDENFKITDFKDYLKSHQEILKKIIKTFVETFSLGFNEKGLNKSNQSQKEEESLLVEDTFLSSNFGATPSANASISVNGTQTEESSTLKPKFDIFGNTINSEETSEGNEASVGPGAASNTDSIIDNSKQQYILNNLNPMSYINFFLDGLAKDLSLYLSSDDFSLDVFDTGAFNSNKISEGALRKLLINFYYHGYAGSKIYTDSLPFFLSSFLGTLGDGLNKAQLSQDTDFSTRGLIKGLLVNEAHYNFSKSILSLFKNVNLTTTGNDPVFQSKNDETVEDAKKRTRFWRRRNSAPVPGITFDGIMADGQIYYGTDLSLQNNINYKNVYGEIQPTENETINSVTTELSTIDLSAITYSDENQTDLDPGQSDFSSIRNPRGLIREGYSPYYRDFLRSLFKHMPKYTTNYDSNNNVHTPSTYIYYTYINSSTDPTPAQILSVLSNPSFSTTANSPGVNITQSGNLEKSIIANAPLLNGYNNVQFNQNLSFPRIENLSNEEMANLTLKTYFELSNNDIKALNLQGSGGLLNTNTIHVYLVFYLFTIDLINKSTFQQVKLKNNVPTIKYSLPRIKGMIDALRNKPNDSEEVQSKKNLREGYKIGYNEAKKIIDQVKRKIVERNKNILNSLCAFQNQIEKIDKYLDKLAALNNLSVNYPSVIKDMNRFLTVDKNKIPFTPSGKNYGSIDYLHSFNLSKEYFPLPESNILANNDIDLKIMYKLFTFDNQDFLRDKLQNTKKIFNIGLSDLTLRNLYIDAGQKSNLIYIQVDKRNQFDVNDIFLPKYYVFDISKYIFSSYDSSINFVDPPNRNIANHIINYRDDLNYRQLLDSIEFLELTTYGFKTLGSGTSSLVSNGQLGEIKNNYSQKRKNDIANALQRNHVLDYYLKLYTKTITGADINESYFPLLDNVFPENSIDASIFANNVYKKITANIQDTLNTRTNNLNVNIQKNEIKKAEKIIRSSPIFNAQARAENNIYNAGCFNRIFSILVDESTFINKTNLSNAANSNLEFNITYDGRNTTTILTPSENLNSIYSYSIKIGLLERW